MRAIPSGGDLVRRAREQVLARRSVIEPSSGRDRRLTQLNSVVLPAPLGPISPQISPAADLESGPVEGDDAPETHHHILDGQHSSPSPGGGGYLSTGGSPPTRSPSARKARPERALGVLLVERSRRCPARTSASIDGVSVCTSPGRSSTVAGERQRELVERVERLGAHDHDDLGLDDRDLLDQPREALGRRQRGVGHRALHAQRAVDGQRVDVEPPQRLHQRRCRRGRRRRRPPRSPTGAGAYLSRKTSACGWPEPSTGIRLPRGQLLAALQVAGELVELADRSLEVLLADLVVGGGHPAERVRPSRPRSPCPCITALRATFAHAALAGGPAGGRRRRLGLEELERLHVERAD